MVHGNPDFERKTGLILLGTNVVGILLVAAVSSAEKFLTGESHPDVWTGIIEGAPAMCLLIWGLARMIPISTV